MNCLDGLKLLDDNSINCCVTSPPYWGLRDYGTSKWEGGNPECEHTINDGTYDPKKGVMVERPIRGNDKTKCLKCGAIRIDKQFGLETTPEEYVENMVAVFREVKRVLRDDGTLWLNLGDSYIGGGRAGQGKHAYGGLEKGMSDCGLVYGRPTGKIAGYKSKDLVGIPWMVAFALRADGWYLRQDIIWHKPNPMPESVTDRCTKAHEYIFLFSKSQHYYYDNEAIKEKTLTQDNTNRDRDNTRLNNTPGRTKMAGLKTNNYEKRNKRSVWTVTTQPFKEAHFAVFPPKLIEPCILAGCPKDGVVLDPFMGSGTTAMVAIQNSRNYIGFELNSEYIKIADDVRTNNVQIKMML